MDIKAFFELKRIAKDVDPDIIHLHSSKAGALGRWAFDGRKIPMFYTPHGYSFLMKNHSALRRFVYRMVELLSSKRSCITISCSEGSIRRHLNLQSKLHMWTMEINIAALSEVLSSIEPISSDTFTVFTLGRICYQKNPALFNQVAEALPDVHFIWIGDGGMSNLLSASNIEVTGWLDRSEALTIAASADAFILTSLWEGLPISLLEAMFMNKPCVVNDVIGNHDVITDGRNGYVCNEVSDFVESIKDIQAGNANELIKTAYEDVLNNYNIDIMAEKYSEIYETALSEFRGGALLLNTYTNKTMGITLCYA